MAGSLQAVQEARPCLLPISAPFTRLKSAIQPLMSSVPPGKDQQKPSLFQQRWEAARTPGLGAPSASGRGKYRSLRAPLGALGWEEHWVTCPERGAACPSPMGTKVKPTGRGKGGEQSVSKAPKKSTPISYSFDLKKVCTRCPVHFERVPVLPPKISTAPLE